MAALPIGEQLHTDLWRRPSPQLPHRLSEQLFLTRIDRTANPISDLAPASSTSTPDITSRMVASQELSFGGVRRHPVILTKQSIHFLKPLLCMSSSSDLKFAETQYQQ
ncbi:hypothetical protein KR51_00003600 [Rubidibacter lacunae KORDI 51-2]|uniref:Uncharacterized protein n=1 Tax=Rubidibacter lacunae KORDI 51-2 TaxID=582515 RepID=U5DQZ7_9CHRO|nr:hypothetical protein KR51_00003600 [Rubidibacter lacunae KORDI 51-2]